MIRFLAAVIFSILSLSSCAPKIETAAPSVRFKLPQLAVVKTYGDLLKTPSIELFQEARITTKNQFDPPIPYSIQLGQSAASSPVNTAVVIYCLTKNFDAFYGTYAAPDIIGPLRLVVMHEDRTRIFEDSRTDGKYPSIARWQWQTTRESQIIFAMTLRIDRPGRYNVTVETLDGKPLAKSTIDGTRDFYHPWTSLFLERAAEWEWVDRSNYRHRQKTPAEVSVPGRGIVVPNLVGSNFEAYSGTAFLGGKRPETFIGVPMMPLPNIEPVPSFQLRRDGDLIVLASDKRIESYGPSDHFIARWWVNGKPFVPTDVDPAEETVYDGLVISEETYQIKLKLDPEKLGARPGDRVALQLMMVNSWLPIKNGKDPLYASGGALGVSNKIEWTIAK